LASLESRREKGGTVNIMGISKGGGSCWKRQQEGQEGTHWSAGGKKHGEEEGGDYCGII